MVTNTALRTGTAFSATVSLAYIACALIFWLWPEGAADFMNALFHGLDFRRLQSGSTLFSFGSFFYALVIFAVWAFLLGAFFGWFWTWLGGGDTSGVRPTSSPLRHEEVIRSKE